MRYASTKCSKCGRRCMLPPSPLRHSQNNSIGDTCKEYALRKPASKRGGASLIEVRPPPFPDGPLALAGLLQAKGDPPRQRGAGGPSSGLGPQEKKRGAGCFHGPGAQEPKT